MLHIEPISGWPFTMMINEIIRKCSTLWLSKFSFSLAEKRNRIKREATPSASYCLVHIGIFVWHSQYADKNSKKKEQVRSSIKIKIIAKKIGEKLMSTCKGQFQNVFNQPKFSTDSTSHDILLFVLQIILPVCGQSQWTICEFKKSQIKRRQLND